MLNSYREPFGVKDETNALLIARYLIEPNDEDTLIFDVTRTQEMIIMKSVFRKLVGSYTLISESDAKAINNELVEVTSWFCSS